MGHDDRAFFTSASVNNPAPAKLSAVVNALFHAMLLGFSRERPFHLNRTMFEIKDHCKRV